MAEEAGITAADVGAVQGIAMAVAAGRVNSLMREQETRRRQENE
ncbi:MAG: hypothetical protein R6W66_04850 [Pelovirga sp.]